MELGVKGKEEEETERRVQQSEVSNDATQGLRVLISEAEEELPEDEFLGVD